MASLTTGQFLAQFAGLPGKATAQGLGVATIHSAVMDPEDESVRRNSLAGTIRADLFEGPESLLVKAGAGQQIITDALNAIKADAGSTNRVLAWIASCIDTIMLDREKEAVARVKNRTAPIFTSLNTIAGEIATLETEAKQLLAATSASTTLRVTGTTGVTPSQAKAKWELTRNSILRAWHSRKVSQDKRRTTLTQLNDGSVSGDDSADVKKELRAAAKDLEQLAEMELVSSYALYSGDGEAVAKERDEYKPFPIPASVESGDYEKYKEAYKTWRGASATIRRYPLILYDIDYMYDVVDAVEAMHLRPPDASATWVETSVNMSSDIMEQRKIMWRDLYREMFAAATPAVKDWTYVFHAVGQQAKTMVEIKDGDGLNFVYALLSEHVKFTAADQQYHTTMLMNMTSLFANAGGANPIKQIELARQRLRAARDVGVYPEYDLCGRDVLKALSNMSTEIYNELSREKLLEPDVRSHPCWNPLDCSALVQSALEKVMAILRQKCALEDRQHTGTRKHEEAGANIGALATGRVSARKEQVLTKARQLDHLCMKSARQNDLSKAQKETMRKHVDANFVELEAAGFHEAELQIEACALTLSNGQKLQEPALTKAINSLRQRGTWKGRSVQPGTSSNNKSPKKSPKRQAPGSDKICPFKGCTRVLGLQRDGSTFKYCRKHTRKDEVGPADDDSKRRRQDIPGRTVEMQNQTQGKVTVTLSSSSGDTKEHQLDANTVKVLMDARKNGNMVCDGDDLTPQEQVAAFLSGSI